ncbi:hypothetical protein QVD17_16966 [Tagetes erecta]|uniref:EGF-like domain-containing protein n=1 Tax=Tagetes erecta TaxID=13708 RepID=A0AAD8KV20_TARER|nr:hypothetical protein QVD17_16966 [Tagetes erecta]
MFTRTMLLLFMIKTCCLTETLSQTLPGCQERCGSIMIPYPFGITPNCSAHESFSITCNTSFNPPRPFITNNNLEVLDISLDGTARVNNPLLTYNCSGRTDRLDVNFTNTPFTYSSTFTRFTAIGCNNLALISRLTTVIGGCISLCNITVPDNTCYGILCCQTNIPSSLKFINASLSSIASGNDQQGCKYAFMVDVDWFANLTNIYEVQNMPTVPAVLDWRLSGNCNAYGPLVSGLYTSVCGSNAFCSNRSICSCFQGNPYISSGCQDINECASSSTNDCEFYCFNTLGSYRCSCPNGYVINGNSCLKIQTNNKIKAILIGCFSGLGALLALFVVWWLHKVMKKRKKDMLKDIYFKRNGGLLLQQQMSSGDDGNEDHLLDIIDHRVKIEGGKDQIKRFAKLANSCLSLDGRRRPKMKQVAIELELIRTSDERDTTNEVEYDSTKRGGIWDVMSSEIESGPITTSLASDFQPLLL